MLNQGAGFHWSIFIHLVCNQYATNTKLNIFNVLTSGKGCGIIEDAEGRTKAGANKMKLTKKSMLTGLTHTMELPITEAQLDAFEKGDQLIQNAFPDLTADQREFILTGSTAEEWEAIREYYEDE